MSLSTTPRHFYMVTALVTYVREDRPHQRHMNIVLDSLKRPVTLRSLNQAQFNLVQRLIQEKTIDGIEQIADFVFINISHLGHMPMAEFRDNVDKEQKTAASGDALH